MINNTFLCIFNSSRFLWGLDDMGKNFAVNVVLN